MIYVLFDCLEVLLGSIFIAVFCDIENKKRFCFISTLISFFIMELFQKYDLFGNELVYVIAVCNFFIMSLVRGKID